MKEMHITVYDVIIVEEGKCPQVSPLPGVAPIPKRALMIKINTPYTACRQPNQCNVW